MYKEVTLEKTFYFSYHILGFLSHLDKYPLEFTCVDIHFLV